MGYYITNGKRDIRYNLHAWPLLLELAFHYGWTPMGTKVDPQENWNGTYFTNDGAWVTTEDALNLATSLEKALQDIPDVDDDIISSIWGTNIFHLKQGERMTEERWIELDKYLNPPRGEDKSKLLLRFGGEGEKSKLRWFIDLCRDGKGFFIY
ncbi:MAG: hypothetical protein JXB49_34560 [Bacteroidales bacterium]|nr:hypothetical protein [Bacteroidales bacterium]